jgi:hypothetical protein
MLRRYSFYASLRLGGGRNGENLLLRCVDACQSCACGTGTPGGAILADFGRSKRAGVPGKNLLAVYKFMDGKGPLSAEHITPKNAQNSPRFSLLLGGGRPAKHTNVKFYI